MMQPITVLDVFHDHVPEAFGYLANRFGFAIELNDDYAFRAIAPHCHVSIELDWGSIVVSVRRPLRDATVRLAFIVGVSSPEVLFLPRYPWGPEDARDEIDRQARLLREHATSLLEGDFAHWAEIEAHQRAVQDDWKRESERLVHEARVKLVRKRADAAFAKREYAEANRLYESIGEHLGDFERRRFEYARRRTLLVAVPRQRALESLA